MYMIQHEVITKSNGFGNYFINHKLADIDNKRIESNWKQFTNKIKKAIAIASIGSSIVLASMLFGCSAKQTIQPQIEQRYRHVVTTTAKSRNVSMAISKATFEGRLQLADRLQTDTLIGSRVIKQYITRDNSGILYIATVTVAIP